VSSRNVTRRWRCFIGSDGEKHVGHFGITSRFLHSRRARRLPELLPLPPDSPPCDTPDVRSFLAAERSWPWRACRTASRGHSSLRTFLSVASSRLPSSAPGGPSGGTLARFVAGRSAPHRRRFHPSGRRRPKGCRLEARITERHGSNIARRGRADPARDRMAAIGGERPMRASELLC
jgi:hypothetical protein